MVRRAEGDMVRRAEQRCGEESRAERCCGVWKSREDRGGFISYANRTTTATPLAQNTKIIFTATAGITSKEYYIMYTYSKCVFWLVF